MSWPTPPQRSRTMLLDNPLERTTGVLVKSWQADHHQGWPTSMPRLATRGRLRERATPGAASVFRLRNGRTWGLPLPSGAEELTRSHRCMQTSGSAPCERPEFLTRTLPFPIQYVPLCSNMPTNLIESLNMNFTCNVTLVLSLVPISSLSSALFSRLRYHLFLNHTRSMFTVLYRTSPFPTPLQNIHLRLILTSTLTTFRAHGVLSMLSLFSVAGSLQALKARFETSRRLIDSFRWHRHNGLGQWCVWATTYSQSTSASPLGSALMQAYTDIWAMLSRTFCAFMAWALSPSGWMTTSSSEFDANTCKTSTAEGVHGASRYSGMAVASRTEGVSGGVATRYRMAERTNSLRTWFFPSGTCRSDPPEASRTASTPTAWRTSTVSQNPWVSSGSARKMSLLPLVFPLQASNGTWTRVQWLFHLRRRRSTFARSNTGIRAGRTRCRRFRNSTANFGMLHSLSSAGVPTSHPWKPCWTSSGGARFSVAAHSVEKSQDQNQSGISQPSLMQAPVRESQSSLQDAGVHGAFSRGGKQTIEISDGQKPWARNSSFSRSWHSTAPAPLIQTSKSMATTGESSKAGGTVAAGTGKSTPSFGDLQPLWKRTESELTRAMWKAPETRQTTRLEENTPIATSSSHQFPSRRHYGHSWSTSMPPSPQKKGGFEKQGSRYAHWRSQPYPPPKSVDGTAKTTVSRTTRSGGTHTSSNTRNKLSGPLPAAERQRGRPPAYKPGLIPVPSRLRPHCFASERLRHWLPVSSRRPVDSHGLPLALSQTDIQRITDVTAHAWADSTAATYGSGLLIFHVFCDERAIPDEQRAPASELLVLSFVSALAGAYAPSAINNYLNGVRAWHLIHGLDWIVDQERLLNAVKGASKLSPLSSKRVKREPLTRELLNAFDPQRHPSRSALHRERHRDGSEVQVLSLPCTKSAPSGEDISCARQSFPADPWSALDNHLKVNTLPDTSHIFAYKKNGPSDWMGIPLTKRAFQCRLKTALSGLPSTPVIHGHSMRIGGTLEYLLRGVSFETVKSIGRWKSDAFTLYLRRHAQVLAPYLQEHPAALSELTRCTLQLPPVR
ncbi:hypothetical protein C8Q79DRAFT_617894 [Trametes meyenii]|nr:hypothetical protein C8Q79DRAFT_617894 [Trametes meyenii]